MKLMFFVLMSLLHSFHFIFFSFFPESFVHSGADFSSSSQFFFLMISEPRAGGDKEKDIEYKREQGLSRIFSRSSLAEFNVFCCSFSYPQLPAFYNSFAIFYLSLPNFTMPYINYLFY